MDKFQGIYKKKSFYCEEVARKIFIINFKETLLMMEGNKVDKCFSSPLKLLFQSEKKQIIRRKNKKTSIISRSFCRKLFNCLCYYFLSFVLRTQHKVCTGRQFLLHQKLPPSLPCHCCVSHTFKLYIL